MIGEEKPDIERMLAQFGVKLKAANYKKDIKPLLTDVCSAIFGQAAGLTEMLVQHVPSSKQGAKAKVEHLYIGPPVGTHTSLYAQQRKSCMNMYVCKQHRVLKIVITALVSPRMMCCASKPSPPEKCWWLLLCLHGEYQPWPLAVLCSCVF